MSSGEVFECPTLSFYEPAKVARFMYEFEKFNLSHGKVLGVELDINVAHRLGNPGFRERRLLPDSFLWT